MSGWTRTRLKHLASVPITNGLGEPAQFDDRTWPRYIRTTDIGGPRILRDDTFASLPPQTVQQASVVRGDLLMSAAGSVGKTLLYDSEALACYAGYLVRFRPRPGVDSRFVSYWTETPLFMDQIAVGKVTSTIDNFSASKYQNLSIRIPDFNRQRAIADYLDAETARIDLLIAKKRRMIELLCARRAAVIEQHIRRLHEIHGSLPLKYAARRIEVGIVVTPAAWYADSGILALRGLNVQPGEIVLDDIVTISREAHQLHRKSELRAGDIVVVRTGQAGAAAVIPSALDGCNCIDLVIVRPSPRIAPRFMEFVLNSEWTQKHIEEHSVGTIQSHFNVGAMKELPVPVPSLEEQQRVIEHLTTATSRLDRLARVLSEQIDLLAEHRQTLVTAAVAGELDVPGVAA